MSCIAALDDGKWQGFLLKLAWLCWSPPSSPQATGSASILRTVNIWNEFEGLCFNTTRRRGEGLSPRDAQRAVALKRSGSGGFFTASTISTRRETSTTSKTEQMRCQRLLMKASRTPLQITCRIKKRDHQGEARFERLEQ